MTGTLALLAALALPLSALAAPPATDAPAVSPKPAPRALVDAFFAMCVAPGPDPERIDQAVRSLGGTPSASPETTDHMRSYQLTVAGVRSGVAFNGDYCELFLRGGDVRAVVAPFDAVSDVAFADGRHVPQVETAPLGATVLRQLVRQDAATGIGTQLLVVWWARPNAEEELQLARLTHAPEPVADIPLATAPAAEPPPPPPPPPSLTRLPGDPEVPSPDHSIRAIYPPRYPTAAIQACAHGIVRLRVSIDDKGNPLNVAVDESAGNADLDRAAMDAARYWRFNPGSSGGRPVGGDVIIPVNFANPCDELVVPQTS